MNKDTSNNTLILELTVLFVVLPVIYAFDFAPGIVKILPLFLLFGYCLTALIRNKSFTSEDLSLTGISTYRWLRLALFPILFFLVLWAFFPEYLFADFSNNRRMTFAVVVYPFFSALPQEIIYRKFFYERYEPLVSHKHLPLLMNMVLFSLAHIYFQNFIALALTFFGAFILSRTYFRSKSLLFVSIEHSVFGMALLCSGLNDFFYKAF